VSLSQTDYTAPDTDDPVMLTRALIARPSVTPKDEGALDMVQNALERLGFTCTRLPFEEEGTASIDNLFARLGTGAPHLCFAGHTDVVPPGDEAAWHSPPFAANSVEQDGAEVLIGRGAVDMKGAIACFIAAVSRFVAERGSVPGSVSLLITGDEEGPAINGTRKMLDWVRETRQIPDHCLVGEPTNPDALGDMVKIGRRGSITGRVTVTGVQGHVAYPHRACNPIPVLARFLDRLAGLHWDQGTEHFQPTNLEITTVDVGNPAANVIPAEARATFNLRFNDLQSHEGIEARIVALADEIRAEFGEAAGEVSLSFERGGDVFLTEPGPFIDLVARAIEQVVGRRPELSTSGGTSDARFIKDICPVAEFGLVGRTMHKVDESTPVSDLHQLTEVYSAILKGYFDRGPETA